MFAGKTGCHIGNAHTCVKRGDAIAIAKAQHTQERLHKVLLNNGFRGFVTVNLLPLRSQAGNIQRSAPSSRLESLQNRLATPERQDHDATKSLWIGLSNSLDHWL